MQTTKVVTRISYLDGLRGLAILMVILYHAFISWPGSYPYGNAYANNIVLKNLWLGVELFFLISGYVILMTLEKCSNFSNFMFRRWLRLFPAMLVCTIIIYLSAPLFVYRPLGVPNLHELISGLTFVQPEGWQVIFGGQQGVLERSFWSLFVEVKFYIIAGLLYFGFGTRKMLIGVFCLFLLVLISDQIGLSFPPIRSVKSFQLFNLLMINTSAKYFGWFVSGSLFYLYTKERKLKLLIEALLTGCVSTLIFGGIAPILIVLIFATVIVSDKAKAILSSKLLLFFGFISYPLYLIHDQMMVSMIHTLGLLFPLLPNLMLPIIPILIVTIIAWTVAINAEPLAKVHLKNVAFKLSAFITV